jgi:hypothetical protein
MPSGVSFARAAQLTAARYAIGRAIGATKLSWSEMAELCGLLDPTGNGKDRICKWENGAGPSGPVSTLVDLILEGVQHTDPDVSGFFINYVRETSCEVRIGSRLCGNSFHAMIPY